MERQVIPVRLDPHILEFIDHTARDKARSRSDVIRDILSAAAPERISDAALGVAIRGRKAKKAKHPPKPKKMKRAKPARKAKPARSAKKARKHAKRR